jgi:hypothetical protein
MSTFRAAVVSFIESGHFNRMELRPAERRKAGSTGWRGFHGERPAFHCGRPRERARQLLAQHPALLLEARAPESSPQHDANIHYAGYLTAVDELHFRSALAPGRVER